MDIYIYTVQRDESEDVSGKKMHMIVIVSGAFSQFSDIVIVFE